MAGVLARAESIVSATGAVLSDSEVGLAQLTLPPGWLPATDLNDGSWLQALDPMRNRYLMVISESREDFDAEMDVQEHSSRTRAALAASVRLLAVRGPQERQVAGFRAVQYELDALSDRTLITYLHTTVEGHRAFHQVLAWATRSWFDRPTFENSSTASANGPVPIHVRSRRRRHLWKLRSPPDTTSTEAAC